MKVQRIYTIIALMLFMCCSECIAQDSINYDSLAAMPLKDLLEMKVKGVSKYEEATEKSPASVIIISQSQIEENCYQDLSDVLKNVLSIDIVDNARGFGEYYTIRGVGGNDRFLVTIDGQKLNSVSGIFLSVGNSIPVKFAERIEIIYGPSSAIYGADAFAGIINIVTTKTEDKFSVNANIDYGSLNTINSELVIQHTFNEDLAFYGFAKVFKSNGPNFIGRDTVYDVIKRYESPQRKEFEQPINDHNLFIKTQYKNLTLSFFRQHFNEGNSLGMSTGSYIYNRESKWELNNNIVAANYRKSIIDNSELSLNIAYVNYQLAPETKFFKWERKGDFKNTFSQYMTGIDNTIRSSVSFSRKFRTNTLLISGIEQEFTNSIPPYANDQVLGGANKYEGGYVSVIKDSLTINEQRYAGYIQLKQPITKNIDVVLGGRYDYSKLNKETINPRFSLMYAPSNRLTLKFLYGTAFQAPSLFYKYEQWGAPTAVMHSSEEVDVIENRWKLDNQKIETQEANANIEVNKNLVVYLSVYHSHLENLIERVVYSDSAYNKYYSTSDTAYYTIGIRNENVGKQRVQGLNIKTELALGTKIYSYFSYSYTNAYALKENRREDISRIARHKVWCGAIYKNIFDRFSISMRAKWIGDVNNSNVAAYPNGKQLGYFNLDASIRLVNLMKSVVFYARFDNVLNSKYQHAGILDQIVYLPSIPQNGFVARAGIEMKIGK